MDLNGYSVHYIYSHYSAGPSAHNFETQIKIPLIPDILTILDTRLSRYIDLKGYSVYSGYSHYSAWSFGSEL